MKTRTLKKTNERKPRKAVIQTANDKTIEDMKKTRSGRIRIDRWAAEKPNEKDFDAAMRELIQDIDDHLVDQSLEFGCGNNRREQKDTVFELPESVKRGLAPRLHFEPDGAGECEGGN
jgi:hypothetical protein